MTAPGPAAPRVSVVVPAYDAAATLAETLDSLGAQTIRDWEAVVVDVGSTDGTGAVAARYAAVDARVRVVTQAPAGKSVARNAGVASARGEWLLFLDADDWMAPVALERFLAATAADVDAVIAGWERVSEDGTRIRDPFRPDESDLFPTLARFCPFAVHACLLRRSVGESVGLFDPTLVVGEDWDLWQRVARSGASFAAVDEVLAFYRIRPRSAAMDVPRLLEAGRRVIARGHAPDPRVSAPDSRYAAGMPASEMPGAMLRHVCWAAGLLIGSGGDAAALLADFRDARDPTLDPAGVAHSLFWAALLPESTPPSSWAARWPRVERSVRAFLLALGRVSSAVALAPRAARTLERLVLEHARGGGIRRVGAICVVDLEVHAPLADVHAEVGVERVLCRISVGGAALGTIELPVCDGVVPAGVLADVVADRFGWAILGGYFAQAVYPTLERREAEEGTELWRGEVRLTGATSRDLEGTSLHDEIGWAVLLQEVWGERDRHASWFYDDSPGDTLEATSSAESAPAVAATATRAANLEAPSEGLVAVELSEPLVDLAATGEYVAVELRVGGASVATAQVPTDGGHARARTVMARVNGAAGYELARVVVREALVGQPVDGPPLRERLATAAGRARHETSLDACSPWVGASGGSALVLGRHPGAVGTSASRRAALPSAAASALRLAAAAAGETTYDVGGTRGRPARTLYVPELHASATSGRAATAEPIAERSTAAGEAEDAGGASGDRRLSDGETPASSCELPILRYDALEPAAFESHLRELRTAGFRSISLDGWRAAAQTSTPLHGRPTVLTFDDPGAWFADVAWPILQRYGFGALVFVTTDRIDLGPSRHDAPVDGAAFTWDVARRLYAEGVAFGSRTASGASLAIASPADVVRETARSRAAIARELGTPPAALAYPDGAEDTVVQHIVGAVGYTFALTHRAERCTFGDPLLALPRLALGSTSLAPLLARRA